MSPFSLVALTTSASAFAAASAANCSLSKLHVGMNHKGTNYKSFTCTSVDECRQRCCEEADAGCGAFTFSSSVTFGSPQCAKGSPCCWLKHRDDGAFVAKTSCTSGEVSPAPSPPAPPTQVPGAPRHILALLVDDYGWADAGWHVEGSAAAADVRTPTLDRLVAEGVNLDRNYAFACCSPSRSATQSGRNPIHVNTFNLDVSMYNPKDNVSGFAGVPRAMTGVAEVLKGAGYATHFFGKWDVGMATLEQTPRGRGYDTSLGYFHHMNNYYTSTFPGATGLTDHWKECKKLAPGVRPVDLWMANSSYEGPALGLENAADCNPGDYDVCGSLSQCPPYPGFPNAETPGCKHEDELFLEALLHEIDGHDVARPFFAFWAPHIVHTPLMVPKAYYDRFGNVSDSVRRRYLSMVLFLDDAIASVVQKLKGKGMYENLLIVMSSDNGGPIYQEGNAGASNWPLRGGKFGNFEGGIRVNGFVSGGLVPKEMRGRTLAGLTTVWDWYATFAEVAGISDISDAKAEAAGLPAVDSISQWRYWSGATTKPPRNSIALGVPNSKEVQGVILDKGTAGLWKLLTGTVKSNHWTGPLFPTGDHKKFGNFQCGDACLFRLDADPSEHVDLAANETSLVKELQAMKVEAAKTVFQPDRGSSDPSACVAAVQNHGGFWGPWVQTHAIATVAFV